MAAVQSAMPASATVTLTSCTGIARRKLSSHQEGKAVLLLGNATIIYSGAVLAYSVSSGSTRLNSTFLRATISNGISAISATLANKSYPGASVSAPTMVDLSPTASPTIPLRPPIPKIKRVYVAPGASNATVIVALQLSVAPLTVYCLTLKLWQGPPTSVGLIRTTGASRQFNPGDNSNVTVSVSGLNALQSYQVFCFVQLSDGTGGSLSDVVNSATAFNTTCCKAITFINAPVSVMGDVTLYTSNSPQSLYIFRVALESAPMNGNVTIVPRIRLSNGYALNRTQAVNATPSSLTFSSTTPSRLTGQFFLNALPFIKGSYVIDLRVQGSASSQYFGGASTAVTVLSSSQPLPAPRLLSVIFANSGGYVVISFDTATDQGGISDNSWSCDRLFTFIGASIASCAWADLSTIRAYPSPSSTNPNTPSRAMQPGDAITLVGGKVRVQCRAGTICTANAAVATITTSIQLPLSPLIPTVSVNVPNSVGGCSDLFVDLSSSTGSGGRIWRSVKWNVAAEVGDPSSVANYLSSYYDFNYNSALIPKSLLLITKYSITATLVNFLNGSASGTSSVTISGDINLPIASILGPSIVNTKANAILALVGNAALSPCSQSNVLKYTWTMQVLEDPTKTFASTSINPTKFQINSYTLTAGSTYGVILRVDVMKDAVSNVVLSSATTAPTSVFVLFGNVIAAVKGGLSRQNPVDRSLLLDASSSYDENSLTTVLTYSWNCTIASIGKQFGQICDFSSLYVATVTSSILVLPPNAMTIPGLIYAFGVMAISPDGRTGNQVVAVTAGVTGAPLVSSNAKALTFNFDSKLNVYAYITASQAVVGTWTVSYASLAVSTLSSLTSPVSTFTAEQVSTAIAFPISFPANTFVAGRSYSFTLSASPVADSSIVASTQITLVCNSPPTGGYVLIAPSSGYALSTIFVMSASGWVDDPHNYPLTFSFSYSRAVSILIPPLTIKALSTLSYANSQLPEGLASQNKSISIINLCCNQYLACANSSAPVTVSVNGTANVLNLLSSSLSASLASGDVDSIFNTINLVSSTISMSNCTAAPPSFCTARNRFPCLEAGNPNECGSCLVGFKGTVGDGNLLCVNASSIIGRNGAACTKDTDCLYNRCVAGSCTAPTRTCPTNVPGTSCSTFGTCALTDLSGNVVSACSVVDTTCTAICHCQGGYGGVDCSLGPKELTARTAARTSMCAALVSVIKTQDKSSHLLDVIVTALLSSYEVSNLSHTAFARHHYSSPTLLNIAHITHHSLVLITPFLDVHYPQFMEINEISGQVTCSQVLNFLALMSSKGYMRGAQLQTQQFYAEISSQFIPASAGGGLLPSATVNSTTAKSAASAAAVLDAHVSRAVSGITNGALSAMVEGQQPTNVVTTNVCATMQSQVVTNKTMAAFAPPQSEEQAQYGAPQPTIQVVGSNLLKCNFGGGYAQTSSAQFGSNPHQGSAAVTSPLLQFGTRSTTQIPISVQIVAAVSASFAAVTRANEQHRHHHIVDQQEERESRPEAGRRKLQVLTAVTTKPSYTPTVVPSIATTRSPTTRAPTGPTASPSLSAVPSIHPSFATPKRPSPPPSIAPSRIPTRTPTAYPTNVVRIPAYYVTLPLIGNKHYNLTQYRLSKGRKGLSNYSIPVCSLYSGGKYISCGSCNITSFTMVNVTYGCYDITYLCPVTTSATVRRLGIDDDGSDVYRGNGGGTLDVGGPLEEDEMDMSIDGYDFNFAHISDSEVMQGLTSDKSGYKQQQSRTEVEDVSLVGYHRVHNNTSSLVLLTEHLSMIYRQLRGGGGRGSGSAGNTAGGHDDLILKTFNSSHADDQSDDAPKEDDGTFTLKTNANVNEFSALTNAIAAEIVTVLQPLRIDLAKAAPALAFVGCMVGIWLIGSLFFLRWDKTDRHQLVYLREYRVLAAYRKIKEDVQKGGSGVIDDAEFSGLILGAKTLHEQINRTLDTLKTSFSPQEFFKAHKRHAIYAGWYLLSRLRICPICLSPPCI